MIELKVSGMSCGGCERNVKKTLARLEPAAEVTVELASGQVRISGSLTASAAIAALEAAGYPAVEA